MFISVTCKWCIQGLNFGFGSCQKQDRTILSWFCCYKSLFFVAHSSILGNIGDDHCNYFLLIRGQSKLGKMQESIKKQNTKLHNITTRKVKHIVETQIVITIIRIQIYKSMAQLLGRSSLLLRCLHLLFLAWWSLHCSISSEK